MSKTYYIGCSRRNGLLLAVPLLELGPLMAGQDPTEVAHLLSLNLPKDQRVWFEWGDGLVVIGMWLARVVVKQDSAFLQCDVLNSTLVKRWGCWPVEQLETIVLDVSLGKIALCEGD